MLISPAVLQQNLKVFGLIAADVDPSNKQSQSGAYTVPEHVHALVVPLQPSRLQPSDSV